MLCTVLCVWSRTHGQTGRQTDRQTDIEQTDVERERDLSKGRVNLWGGIAVSNGLVKPNGSDGLWLLKGRKRNVHCTVDKHEKTELVKQRWTHRQSHVTATKEMFRQVLRLRHYERILVHNWRFRSNGADWPKISGRRGRSPTTIFLLRKLG